MSVPTSNVTWAQLYGEQPGICSRALQAKGKNGRVVFSIGYDFVTKGDGEVEVLACVSVENIDTKYRYHPGKTMPPKWWDCVTRAASEASCDLSQEIIDDFVTNMG